MADTNRPFKHLSDKYLDAVKKWSSKGYKTADEFSANAEAMLSNITRHLESNGNNPQDVVNKKSHLGKGWVENYKLLIAEYKTIRRAYDHLVDEEKAIERMDRKAHIRATAFRFLTTLGIGFGVMIVYWVAGCLEIAMPLMRMPL